MSELSENVEQDGRDVVRGWNAAAEVADRSVASLRKLVESGRLEAEKDKDGVYVMRRADLLALPRVVRGPELGEVDGDGPSAEAEVAMPAAAPSAPTTDATCEAGLDGVLAAKLFEAFESGATVIGVVVATKVAPSVVETTHEMWKRLKSADATAPSAHLDTVEADLKQVCEALGQLSELVDGLAETLSDETTRSWRTQQSLAAVANRVAAIERHWRR